MTLQIVASGRAWLLKLRTASSRSQRHRAFCGRR
jgi:hypothetical protein